MHSGQARYVAFGTNWMDTVAAREHRVLPPDVEPLPERTGQALQQWLEKRQIAACDRGAACKGLRLGETLGDIVLAMASVFKASLSRTSRAGVLARDAKSHASLPRLRRAPFYRRARALQFKRHPGR